MLALADGIEWDNRALLLHVPATAELQQLIEGAVGHPLSALPGRARCVHADMFVGAPNEARREGTGFREAAELHQQAQQHRR